MTEKTQPTDAEIRDAADDFRSQYNHGGTTFDEFDALSFARAVLAKWGTPQPTQAQAGAVPLTADQVDAAAKKLAECMDYPWDHMPEQGRAEMRKHAQAVLSAANCRPPPPTA